MQFPIAFHTYFFSSPSVSLRVEKQEISSHGEKMKRCQQLLSQTRAHGRELFFLCLSLAGQPHYTWWRLFEPLSSSLEHWALYSYGRAHNGQGLENRKSDSHWVIECSIWNTGRSRAERWKQVCTPSQLPQLRRSCYWGIADQIKLLEL